jgi:predicted alpha/beta hydrolase
MITESLTLVTTKDNAQVAVWKVIDNAKLGSTAKSATNKNSANKGQNILLTHGTFSDKRVCLGVANYLAKLGHSCYIMEWRGHGHSAVPKQKFNFETVALYDLDATLHYLLDELQLPNLHSVTHSGGGICLTMFLIKNTHYIDKLASITLLGCQAYGAVSHPKSYARILSIKAINRLLGYLPAKTLKLGLINESYHTMKQWYNWNLTQNFKSSLAKRDIHYTKNFDYRQHMPEITTPIYAISAKGDAVIAPPRGCEIFLNDFNNPANVFRQFSIANGDLEDYNHSRVILSGNAAKEIWPSVAAWIEQHSKKLD